MSGNRQIAASASGALVVISSLLRRSNVLRSEGAQLDRKDFYSTNSTDFKRDSEAEKSNTGLLLSIDEIRILSLLRIAKR